jgi:hypothetical protein
MMPESHSKGEQRHRPLVSASTGSQTATTRAANGLPFKPYVYRGGEVEPPAVTAARQRHRALDGEIARRNAALTAEEAMPDLMPDYEWYRELADDE